MNQDKIEENVKDHWKDKVCFIQDVEFLITGPGKKRNPMVGGTWMRGMMEDEEFRKKIKEGTGNQDIELSKFPGQNFDSRDEDPNYYYSGLPLNHYEQPRSIKKKVDSLISGQALLPERPLGWKPRRKKKRSELQKILKAVRHRDNRKCQICNEITDKKKELVFESRCRCCSIENGVTPSAVRIHVACYKSKGITQLPCNSCQTVIGLPVDDN